MRTTLTLEDDLAATLRRLARQRRTSFKAIVNQVLRRGLSKQDPSVEPAEEYRVSTFRSAFRPGVDVLRLNTLSDELEMRAAMGENPDRS